MRSVPRIKYALCLATASLIVYGCNNDTVTPAPHPEGGVNTEGKAGAAPKIGVPKPTKGKSLGPPLFKKD